jgi:hypothetical protein
MSDKFEITGIVSKTLPHGAMVEVTVIYNGGMRVFTFPKHFTQQTILSQIRNQVRAEKHQETGLEKFTGLIGKHDL